MSTVSVMHTMKVVIGGASGVGTTTYLHRLVHDEFLDDTTSTVGISFLTKVVQRGDRAVTLMLWDLSGQERYRFFQPSYVQGATAGIVLFDLCRIWSLFQVQEWVVMFKKYATTSLPIVLGGTKRDCISDAEFTSIRDQALETVANLGLMCFVPTSSKDGTNIDELIRPLIDKVLGMVRRKKI